MGQVDGTNSAAMKCGRYEGYRTFGPIRYCDVQMLRREGKQKEENLAMASTGLCVPSQTQR